MNSRDDKYIEEMARVVRMDDDPLVKEVLNNPLLRRNNRWRDRVTRWLEMEVAEKVPDYHPFLPGPPRERAVAGIADQMDSVDGQYVFRRYASIRRDFDAILRRARIPKKDALGRKVTSHSFRHTYATIMAEATGHNPFVLKEILGHRQLSTTERYCHPAAPQIILPLQISFDQVGVGAGCRVVDVTITNAG